MLLGKAAPPPRIRRPPPYRGAEAPLPPQLHQTATEMAAMMSSTLTTTIMMAALDMRGLRTTMRSSSSSYPMRCAAGEVVVSSDSSHTLQFSGEVAIFDWGARK